MEEEKKELEIKEKERKEKLSLKKLPKAEVFEKIGKCLIYLLVFLLPLFFLPWTNNVLDFNKQTLLLTLSLLALICWWLKNLISGKFEIKPSFLYLGTVIFLLVSGLAVIFSIFPYGSLWGFPFSISSSFLSLIGFFIFYFLIVNFFKRKDLPFLFLVLFLSGFLVSVFSLFQLFGKFFLPFDFSRTVNFNPIGTINNLAVYLSVLLILVLTFLYFVGRIFKIIFGIFGLFFLFSLILINFKIAWIVLLVGTAALLSIGIIIVNFKKIKSSDFIVSLIIVLLLIISLIFIFSHISPFKEIRINKNWETEVSLSQKAEIEIIKKLPIKSLVLGTGLGTFVYNWSKYKSPDINQTIFWTLRFGSGASEILDRIITTGILGILAFFFLIGSSLKIVFSFLLKEKGVVASELEETEKRLTGDTDQFLAIGILGGLVGLITVFFFYPVNFSLWLIFWFLLGASSLLEKKESKIWLLNISLAKTRLLVFSFLIILILIFGFLILFFTKYWAEVKYLQGIRAWQKGNSVLASNYLLDSTKLNPKIDFYWRDLSQIYLIRLNEVLSNQNLSEQEKITQAQHLIINSINSASQAANLNSRDWVNWAVWGFNYRSLIGALPAEAENLAIKFYQSALELEPTNPYLFSEIGQVYLIKADLAAQKNQQSQKEENLKLAKENFEKAISLKSDYAPAHFQIAMIYVREQKIKEAILKLEEIKQFAPLDNRLAFQLGAIYYTDNQFDKAKRELERAVMLDPNYSNARYFLGLIYDREGKKDKAIAEFIRIEELNPENQEVKKILTNLRAGKSALEEIMPSNQPPPVEKKSSPEKSKK